MSLHPIEFVESNIVNFQRGVLLVRIHGECREIGWRVAMALCRKRVHGG
jgi:hypothetical protein